MKVEFFLPMVPVVTPEIKRELVSKLEKARRIYGPDETIRGRSVTLDTEWVFAGLDPMLARKPDMVLFEECLRKAGFWRHTAQVRKETMTKSKGPVPGVWVRLGVSE